MTKKLMSAAEKAAHFAALKQALRSNPEAVVARTKSGEAREPEQELTDDRVIVAAPIADAWLRHLCGLLEVSFGKPLPASSVEIFRAALDQIYKDYAVNYDDWWVRNARNPNRPSKAWRTELLNFQHKHGSIDTSPFDYGDDRESTASWKAHWSWVYGKQEGNPGTNREVRPGEKNARDYPVTPLYGLYDVLERWFLSEGLKWEPVFLRKNLDTPLGDSWDKTPAKKRSQRVASNAAARVFLEVACWLNPDYLAENCFTVATTKKNDQMSPEAKANRAAKRAAYQVAYRKKRAAKRAAERKPKHTSKPARG